MADIASVLLMVLSVALLVVSMRLHHANTVGLRHFVGSLTAALGIVQRRRLERLEQKNRNRLLEDSVDSGTSAVELVHRAITSTTFSVIDRFSTSERFKASAQKARRTHDDTSRTFYRSIKTTNKTLHALANVLRNNQSQKRDSQSGQSNNRNKPDA